MTLNEYVFKRNGVPMGHSKSLSNNLYRSLGAKNFATFWTYWNPIFGYYLGTYIFKPLKKVFPVWLSLIGTFLFCGALHDAVTTLVKGEISWFITLWFFLMSSGVLLSKGQQYNFNEQSWLVRAVINLVFIGICLVVTIYIIF